LQELPRVGLENPRRTTCFANASIQVLFRFTELMKAMHQDFTNHLIEDPFIVELMNLFKAYVRSENPRTIASCQDRLAMETAKRFPHQVLHDD